MSEQSLAQTKLNGNGNTAIQRPIVTAAADLKTSSGLVIPKGTAGRVLEINRHSLCFVDFGGFPVYSLPLGSPLVRWADLTAAGGER